ELYAAVAIYCNDNQDFFPTVGYWRDGTGYVQYPDDWIWWQANRVLDDCPMARSLNCKRERLRSLLRCPADFFDNRQPFPGISAGQGAYFYSYGLNQGVGVNVKPPL